LCIQSSAIFRPLSIGRINTRCQAIAEELLEVSLHPDRVGARMSTGMSMEDM